MPLPSFEKAELFVPLLRAASGSVAQVPTLGSHADQPSISAQQAKLKNGDTIFTTSIDKIVPPGILVGRLEIVTKVPQDPNMNFGRGKGAKPTINNTDNIKMSIDLAFEINQLDYVTIMSLKK